MKALKAQALVLWVTATTVVLTAIPFVLLALALHHSSRHAAGHSGRGFHDGE